MAEGQISRKVLIIDDEEMIRNIVKRILKLKGHETVEAKSGDEAIEILEKSPNEFDFAILDLSMPGLSGDETFYRIRELKPALNIIIATGFIGSSESQQFLNNGAIAILEKPFKMDQLLNIMKTI